MLGCLSTSLFAQDESLKPVQGDLGVTVGINGLSNVGFNFGIGHSGTILFHYYLSNTWSLRGQLNISTQSSSQSYSDSTSIGRPANLSITGSSSSWSIGLGIQHSFEATKRLDPYLALEVYLGTGKSGKSDSSATATTGAAYSYDATIDPGSTFTFGAGLVFGFNYFITNHIAVGGEFLAGLAINNMGDGTRTVTETGFPTTTSTTHGVNNTSFGPNGSALVTFSYYFPAKW